MTTSGDTSKAGCIRPSLQEALSTAAALASVVHSDSQNYSALVSTPIPGIASVMTPVSSIPIVPAGLPPAPAPFVHAGENPGQAPNATATLQPTPAFSYATAQQHQAMTPQTEVHQTQHQLQPQPQQLQPQSSIFESMKLRRGKWTAEEEEYADLLIKEFERGTVEGCENGCTLRSFLSKKLHCAPMRISKKYAGKSIGKHVFLGRTTVHGIGKPKDGTDNKAKLLELQNNFHKSLFQETEAANSLRNYLPQQIQAGFPCQILSSAPSPYPAHSGCVPYAHPVPLWVVSKEISNPQVSDNQIQHQTNQLHHQTSQLHQTFLSALNQVKPPATLPNHIQSVTVSPVSAPIAISNVTALAPATAVNSIAPNQIAPDGLHSRPQDLQKLSGLRVPHPLHTIPAQTSALLPIAPKLHSYHESIEHKQSSYSDPGTSDIPDFLSGFDKVAAEKSMKTQQEAIIQVVSNAPVVSSEYSPPFTSRSFDDLHQHLGRGLSPRPFDLNSAEKTVTADSYALFAQESAFAVSQHSAYRRTTAISIPTMALSETPIEAQPNFTLTPSVVNAANLRAHSMATGEKHMVSGSERSSEWGTEGSESTGVSSSRGGSGSDSDNLSDSRSTHDSDANSLEGRQNKKARFEHQED